MVVVLLLIAFVCEILAAVGVSAPRVQLLPLGLAFLIAAMLVGPMSLLVR